VSGVVYGCLWLLCNGLGRLFLGYRTIGQGHIPRCGGVLIAANHASYLDIPLLACGTLRRLAFLGRHDLFPVPLGWILRWLGWIPIRPDRYDRAGFGKAIELIERGKAVVIYPEGSRTRDGKLQRGKPGVGIIVKQTHCPVVPAYIDGSFEILPRGRMWPRRHPVRVLYGELLDFSSDAQRFPAKEFYRHVSRTVMIRIAELGQVAPPGESDSGSRAFLG
jgi:1-acyl-sn-glycerol-3-phosphate acyltransferase